MHNNSYQRCHLLAPRELIGANCQSLFTSQSHLGLAASNMNFLLVVIPLVALIIQAPTGTADSKVFDTTERPVVHLVTVYHCTS